jgi:hypothetical protein
MLLCEGDAKNFNRPKREIKRKNLDYAVAQDEKKRQKGVKDGQQERKRHSQPNTFANDGKLLRNTNMAVQNTATPLRNLGGQPTRSSRRKRAGTTEQCVILYQCIYCKDAFSDPPKET